MLADGNQNEAFIAVDPSDPMRAFAISRTAPFSEGVLAAYSTNGGLTWTPARLGDDGDAQGEGDPWAVFTEQGTLFVSYLDFDPSAGRTVILQSNDGGATFEPPVAELGLFTDRGSMASGPAGAGAPGAAASLWVTYRDQATSRIVVEGAALDSTGVPINDFCGLGSGVFCVKEPNLAAADPTGDVSPGHIAVGPSGQVLVSYMRLDNDFTEGPTDIFAELDPDGLGPAPFAPVPAGGAPILTTNLGFQSFIPPHASRKVTPLANLAWDRSSGTIYLVSTSEEPDQSLETDIVLLRSDDDGATWSDPLKLNDDPPASIDPQTGEPVASEVRSQFFPHIAVDQATGLVVVTWYDPRNDDGGADGLPNTETQVFAAITQDLEYVPNLQVSAPGFFSRPTDLETSHGEYLGVAVHDGDIHFAWVDNSNSVGDNPDAGIPLGCGSVPCMDLYTALPEPEPDASLLAGAAVLCGLALRRRACARSHAYPSRASSPV